MKTPRRGKWGRRGIRGFSVTELLLAVAILAVLGGIGAVSGQRIVRSTRQTALDRMAEQIYMAASRNIRSLESAGQQRKVIDLADRLIALRAELYPSQEMRLPALSNVDTELTYADGDLADSVRATWQELRDLILPRESVSPELWSGQWALEFVPGSDGRTRNPETGQWETDVYQPMCVNSAFFSRQEDLNYYASMDVGADHTHSSLWFLLEEEELRNSLMDRSFRMNHADARVGYYDGADLGEIDGVSHASAAKKGSVGLTVDNGEKLTVRAMCELSSADEPPSFVLKLSGADGDGYLVSRPDELKIETVDGKAVWVWTVTLDSLEAPETQFKNLGFFEDPQALDSVRRLTPGENYALTLTAELNGKKAEASSHPVVNSLFDARAEGGDGEADTLYVSCGRHLQNLDPVLSGVRGTASAVQTADISFAPGSPWAEAYHDAAGNPATFLPIYGDYDGSNPSEPAGTFHLDSYHSLPVRGDDGRADGYHAVNGLTIGAPATRPGAAQDSEAAAEKQYDDRKNAGLFGTFSGSAVTGVTLADASISGGPEGGYESAGALIGAAWPSGQTLTVRNTAVTAPLSGDRPLISQAAEAKSAGGLIGTVAGGGSGTGGGSGAGGASGGTVKLDHCGAYLTGNKSSDRDTADKLDILYGAAAAGGLVGQSAGNLEMTASYADLVISSAPADGGSGTTGGLIGASHGNLSVSGSYADCYLSGGTIGGIAGSLGEDTETTFERTYSAGFALYHGAEPDAATTAGGQFFGTAGDGARVSFASPSAGPDGDEKCYSLFNFTDVTSTPAGTGGSTGTGAESDGTAGTGAESDGTAGTDAGTETAERPKLSNITDQTEGDGISGGENFLYTAEQLDAIRLDRLDYSGDGTPGAANAYNLAKTDLEMGDSFPYPGFGLPHHGDWKPDPDMGLGLDSASRGIRGIPVRIVYLLYDRSGTALATDAPSFDTDGILDGQRFKGTSRLDAAPRSRDTSDAEKAAYGTVLLGVPENITGCAFAGWYASRSFAPGDAIRTADSPSGKVPDLSAAEVYPADGAKGKLSWQYDSAYTAALAAEYEQSRVDGGMFTQPVLYAVYTDARPHTVTLDFLYLDKAAAQRTQSETGNAPSLRDLYLGGYGIKIQQSVHYEIPLEAQGFRPIVLPEIEGYKLLDSNTGELGVNYLGPCARLADAALASTGGDLAPGRDIFAVSVSGVSGGGDILTPGADGTGGDVLTPDADGTGGTLTALTEQSCTYVLLYEYASTSYEIQYAFHHSHRGENESAEAVIEGGLTREAVLDKMNGGPVYSADDSVFRVVKRDLSEDADGSASQYRYEFEGFELYRTENQNLEVGHRTIFHYRRTVHTLSYDLNGGYDTEGGGRTSYRATRSVTFGEPLDGYLPAEAVKRNGYALQTWALDWTDSRGRASKTWDPVQPDTETLQDRIPAPAMPAADVEAAAVWRTALDKVRVEVYYQSVTDPLDAGGGNGAPERTYKLYSVNEMDGKDLLSQSGVPAYGERYFDARGNDAGIRFLTKDHQGNLLSDNERVSEPFSRLSDFLKTAETVQDAEDGALSEEEISALRTQEARRVERYLLPTIMDGKLKLDDYHLKDYYTEQTFEKVTTTPRDYVMCEEGTKTSVYFADTPPDEVTVKSETVQVVDGVKVTTRVIDRIAARFQEGEGGPGYYIWYTRGGEKATSTTLVDSRSGTCYSEVLRFNPENTGLNLPYVDNGGNLVVRLYYDRSLYQMMFHYDAYNAKDINTRVYPCTYWENSFPCEANRYASKNYYEKLGKYPDIPAYLRGEQREPPVNTYMNSQFRVFQQAEDVSYHHDSSTSTSYDLISKRQFVFEALYGAPLDYEALWNARSVNAFVWGQVNGGTYTAQIPLTTFNASVPEGSNRVEYGYFGQNANAGYAKVFIEDDDRTVSSSSANLTEADFQDRNLGHMVNPCWYPPAVFSDDGSKEYAFADGYEFWGYRRYQYQNDLNDLSVTDPSPLGWRGTSQDRTTDLEHTALVINGTSTLAWWPKVYDGNKSPVPADSYTKVILYFQRKTYHIEFSNVLNVPEVSCLYREPVSSLPVPASENCPFGNNYAFKGWYTSSSFADDTRVSDEKGNFTDAFRRNSGLFTLGADGTYGASFRMPSYNLVLVARWEKAANTVTFHPGFPGAGSVFSDDTQWTLTNLAADGSVPDGDFFLLTDEDGVPTGSHQAMMGRLVERYGASAEGRELSYDEEADAWTCLAGDNAWRFDGWFYYTGGGDVSRSGLTQQYNLTAPVVSDDHLYARWTQIRGLLNITVICRDRETREPLRGPGGQMYTQTLPDLNINMDSPETVTIRARTDIPGYFPVLASKDVQVQAENGTVYMDYERGANWNWTIHVRAMLDDGTEVEKPLFADAHAASDKWEAQIPAPQFAGYLLLAAGDFDGSGSFHHRENLAEGLAEGGATSVWERMDGLTRELTAWYIPDAMALTIPTETIRLEVADVGGGWLKSTPLLTGRFYREVQDGAGNVRREPDGMPRLGDGYRLRVTYYAYRTDEGGQPVLDENSEPVRDAVTVYYGATERELLDGNGNTMDRFGFLDDPGVLAADREYEIHVDAAFVDGAGNSVLDLLRDGVPAALAAGAEEGVTPPPCTFTLLVGNPPD